MLLLIRRFMFGAEVAGCVHPLRHPVLPARRDHLRLGLLGEYVGRIYQQVRARPRYLVQTILEQRDGRTTLNKPRQEAVQTVAVVQREEQGR